MNCPAHGVDVTIRKTACSIPEGRWAEKRLGHADLGGNIKETQQTDG